MGKKSLIIIEIISIFLIVLFLGPGKVIFSSQINMLDEGTFAMWAYRMLNGEVPFRDFSLMYGPLFILPTYFAFWLLGVSFLVLRIVFFMQNVLGILIIYGLLTQIKLKNILRWLFLGMLSLLPIMQIRQSGFFLCLVLFLLSLQARKIVFWLLLGVIMIVAILISPESGIYTLILFYFSLLVLFVRKMIATKEFGVVIFGSLLTISIFCLYSKEWLGFYISETFSVLRDFSGAKAPLGKNFPSLLNLLTFQSLGQFAKTVFSYEAFLYWTILLYIIIFFYLIVRLLIYNFTRREGIIFILWGFGVASYLSLLGRSDLSHFYTSLPALLLTIFIFVNELSCLNYKNSLEKYFSKMCIIFLALFLVRIVSFERQKILSFPSKNNTNYKVINTLKDVSVLTKTSDKIFVFQDEPAYYILLKRQNVTRFDLPYIASLRKTRLELLSSLQKHPPKIVIYDQNAWAVDGIPNNIRLPEVYKFIINNYYRISNSSVYILRV